MAGIFNSAIFNNAIFNIGEIGPTPVTATKTGTGGIDPQKRRRIVKPTGFIDKPKAKDARVQERLDETGTIESEIAGRLAKEFGDERASLRQTEEAQAIATLSMAEMDREIGILLRKKLRSQEDEIALLLLMTAAA